MEANRKNLLQSTATYGLILGFIIVVYNLLLYLVGVMPVGIVKPMILFFISTGISFAGILIFSKKIRDEFYEGQINYKSALGVGVLIGFCAAIVGAAYTFLLNKVIDPSYSARLMEAQLEFLANNYVGKGLSGDQIDAILEQAEKAKDVSITFKTYIVSVFSSTLGFTIISLITAAFVRTVKANPFEE